MKPDGYILVFDDGTQVKILGSLVSLAPYVRQHPTTLRGMLRRGRGVIEGVRAENPTTGKHEPCRVLRLFEKEY